jgi:hypothetical protein
MADVADGTSAHKRGGRGRRQVKTAATDTPLAAYPALPALWANLVRLLADPMAEASDGKYALPHHEYEFKSKEDLLRFFRPHFRNVCVFETIHPDRHNLYFRAQDGTIPFISG